HEAAVLELCRGAVRLLAGLVADGRSVRRVADDALPESAPAHVRPRLAFSQPVHVIGVDLLPVPLGAGQVPFRGERGLVDVVAGREDAAFLRSIDRDLGAVDVSGGGVDTPVGGVVYG